MERGSDENCVVERRKREKSEIKEESKTYIQEKLKGAECNQTIYKYCNASILIGDRHKADLITTEIVIQAVNDCKLG